MEPFEHYLTLARALPYEFEHLPGYDMFGQVESGTDLRARWQGAAERQRWGGGLGVHLHFPYCTTKCHYCHCFSVAGGSEEDLSAYQRSLLREMELWSPVFERSTFTNGYVGGGTPTLMGAKRLDACLGHLRRCFTFAEDAQITVEATPRTVDAERIAVLKAHGVERLSMGLQSLEANVLRKSYRGWQTLEMVERAVVLAREGGMAVINADLMAGLPEQTLQGYVDDCRRAAAMGFDTIHVYFFDPDGSPFARGGGHMDGAWGQLRWDMLRAGEATLGDLGYRAVLGETVYARTDDPAVINRYDLERYFRAGSVLGLGFRAYSHLFGGVNYTHRDWRAWSAALDAGGLPSVTLHDGGQMHEMREFLVFNLKDGVDEALFRKLFRTAPQEAFPEAFALLTERGLLAEQDGRLRAQHKSQLEYLALTLCFFADDMLAELRALSARHARGLKTLG